MRAVLGGGLITTSLLAQSYTVAPVRLSDLGEAEIDVSDVSMMLPQRIALHTQQLLRQQRYEELLLFCESSLETLASAGRSVTSKPVAASDPMAHFGRAIRRTLQLNRHAALTKLKRYHDAVSVIREIEAEPSGGTGFGGTGDLMKVQTALLLLDSGEQAQAGELLDQVNLAKTPETMRGLVEPQYNMACAYRAWLLRDDIEATRRAQSVLDTRSKSDRRWDMANRMYRMVAQSISLQSQLRTLPIDSVLRDYHVLYRDHVDILKQLFEVSLTTPLESMDRAFRPTPSLYYPFEHLAKARDPGTARRAWEVLVNSKNRLVDERVLRLGKQREAARDVAWMSGYKQEIEKTRANANNVAATQQAERLLGGLRIGRDSPRALFLDGSVFRNPELRNLAGIAASQWMTDASDLESRKHQLRFDTLNAIANEAAQKFWDRIATTELIQQLDDPATASPAWMTAEEVLGGVEEGTVLLDFVRFPALKVGSLGATNPPRWSDRYGAFVVDDQRVEWCDLGEASDWDAMLRNGLKELREPEDPDLAQWSSLSDRLMSRTGLAKRLDTPPKSAQPNRLVISPDDQFWLVSWPALISNDETFLVETCDILLVDHFRKRLDGQNAAEVAPPRQDAVVFADPNFDLAPKDWHEAESGLPFGVEVSLVSTKPMSQRSLLPEVSRLPGTVVEANAIEESWENRGQGKTQLFLQNEALESQLTRVERPGLLVFSTHGYFLPQQPEWSASARDGEGGKARTVPETVKVDPFYRCGLLLSGCNHSHRWSQLRAADGILTGAEIMYLPLDGTRLVMLSACETGVGDVRNGEGVKGLRQAFQVAGAESVIASSWPVDDRATARLMRDFFREYQWGDAPEKTLAEAQRKRIVDRRKRFGMAHPFFWSAFMCSK
ncbi:MAG: CHAT domain-containing protein [Planctomycetota bacterium]